MTTLACMTCGHQVAPSARRCPSCSEKRPAPTMANAVKALLGAAVLVVVLVEREGFEDDASSYSTEDS